MRASVTSRRKDQAVRVVPTTVRKVAKKRSDTDYLKLVSGDERIIVRPTDGKKTIVQELELFSAGIEKDLKNLDTNVTGQPTEEMVVQIFEMVKSGKLAKMFGSFRENLDHLCMEQSQIISFVENNEKWFRTGSYTIAFLFMVKGVYCVARVTWINGEYYVCIKNLANVYVWPSSSKVRFVVPEP